VAPERVEQNLGAALAADAAGYNRLMCAERGRPSRTPKCKSARSQAHRMAEEAGVPALHP
jgi:hypothetical protein